MIFLILFLLSLLSGLVAAECPTVCPANSPRSCARYHLALEPGYPLAECTDLDNCPSKFQWRGSEWDAPHGICNLCKDLQHDDNFANLPGRVTVTDMKMCLCKKWQAPSHYNCAPKSNARQVDDNTLLGPTEPVFDPGYPQPECTDVDYCPVKFHWRQAPWDVPSGICRLCKDLEANDWKPVPYNSWPDVLKQGLCKKWQAPNTYTC